MFDEELRLAPQIPETRLTLLQRLPDAEDAAAWSAFVDLYGPVILSFSLSRGCPVSDAADLLQEVLVIVARKIRSFEFDPVRGRFRTWLLAIVKYKLIDRIRRQSVSSAMRGIIGGWTRWPIPRRIPMNSGKWSIAGNWSSGRYPNCKASFMERPGRRFAKRRWRTEIPPKWHGNWA